MRHIAAAAFVVAAAATAHAQDPAPAPKPPAPLFIPGIQYGAPLKISGGLAVYLPAREEGGFRSEGWIVEGSAGQAGARGSFGVARFLEYLGLDARAVLHRTWGVAHRLSGSTAGEATMFSWSVGVQYPFSAR